MNAKLELVEFEKSVGRISGSSVCVYPPGIPLIVPGEMITHDIINYIKESYELELEVIGLNEFEDIIKDEINDIKKNEIKDDDIVNNKKRGLGIQCLK